MHRSRHVSVLQQIFNRQDQGWEGLIADDQHLFNVKIKVLMSDDIAKTHGLCSGITPSGPPIQSSA